MKRLFCIICLVLGAISMNAQYRTSSGRPVWLGGYFKDAQYSYVEVVSAVGYDEENAREKALRMIIQRRNISTGARASVSMNGGDIVISGTDELTVKARVLDEYVERVAPGQYRVSLLVQTAKNPEYPFEQVTVTDRYPFTARAFVPGMAQIHKGSTGKGIMFITAEVLCVGGIILSEAMSGSYESMISTTHNPDHMVTYMNKSSAWTTTRNICIAGAAMVYVWNVIDGITAKGKPYISIGYASLDVKPYADRLSAGMSLAFNF